MPSFLLDWYGHIRYPWCSRGSCALSGRIAAIGGLYVFRVWQSVEPACTVTVGNLPVTHPPGPRDRPVLQKAPGGCIHPGAFRWGFPLGLSVAATTATSGRNVPPSRRPGTERMSPARPRERPPRVACCPGRRSRRASWPRFPRSLRCAHCGGPSARLPETGRSSLNSIRLARCSR